MRYGGHVEQLIQAQEAGNKVKALDERPELYEDLRWIYVSFFQLDRPQGMSLTGIPTVEILSYLDLHGVTNMEERTEFFRFIKAMDRAWIHHQASQQKAKSKDK